MTTLMTQNTCHTRGEAVAAERAAGWQRSAPREGTIARGRERRLPHAARFVAGSRMTTALPDPRQLTASHSPQVQFSRAEAHQRLELAFQLRIGVSDEAVEPQDTERAEQAEDSEELEVALALLRCAKEGRGGQGRTGMGGGVAEGEGETPGLGSLGRFGTRRGAFALAGSPSGDVPSAMNAGRMERRSTAD